MAEKCPICGKGRLRSGRISEMVFGLDLGTYDGEVCDNCGESFLSGDAQGQIEEKAKALGVWGLATKVKVARSGNSMVIRIPADLARYLNLKRGQELVISPERKDRLVLELA